MSYILLVEDHAIVAFLLRSQLEAITELEVVIAHSASKAFDRLDQGLPALAFLDISLDGETSFGIAEWLVDQKVPTFAVTSYSKDSLEKMERAVGLEALPVISKTEFAKHAREIIFSLEHGSDGQVRR